MGKPTNALEKVNHKRTSALTNLHYCRFHVLKVTITTTCTKPSWMHWKLCQPRRTKGLWRGLVPVALLLPKANTVPRGVQPVVGLMSGSRANQKEIAMLTQLLLFLLLQPAAPAAPTLVSFTAKLQWDANTEADLAGYKVYWGTASHTYGTPITLGKVTTYDVTNLMAPGTYYFAVTAFNTAGQESGYSNDLQQ